MAIALVAFVVLGLLWQAVPALFSDDSPDAADEPTAPDGDDLWTSEPATDESDSEDDPDGGESGPTEPPDEPQDDVDGTVTVGDVAGGEVDLPAAVVALAEDAAVAVYEGEPSRVPHRGSAPNPSSTGDDVTVEQVRAVVPDEPYVLTVDVTVGDARRVTDLVIAADGDGWTVDWE